MEANKVKWETWGWYSLLDQIAAGDRFRRGGQSKMEGAQLSNFYEAMIWLAKEKHISIDFSQK